MIRVKASQLRWFVCKPRASGDDPQSLYDNGNSFE